MTKISKYSFKIHIIVAALLWIICNIIIRYLLVRIWFSALGDQWLVVLLALNIVLFVICIFGLIRFISYFQKTHKRWIIFYPGIFIITIIIPQIFCFIIGLLTITIELRDYRLFLSGVSAFILWIIGTIIFFEKFSSNTRSLGNIEEQAFSRQDWEKTILFFLIYISIIGGIFLFLRIQSGALTSFCGVVIDQHHRGHCYANLAVAKQDLSICDKSGSQRGECYVKISIIKNDLSICEQIPTSDAYNRDYCLEELAKIREDISLCHKILSSTIKDRCYLYMSRVKHDLSICNLIEDEYKKKVCRGDIK